MFENVCELVAGNIEALCNSKTKVTEFAILNTWF